VATGASDGKMEEGSLRVDANVSVRRAGQQLGTRCEIKNMNSLRSLGRAIEYETARQIALLEAGGRVIQETRGWNEAGGTTHSMRSKEEAYDYRYFPEPDLLPVAPGAEWVAAVARVLPPMPAERRARVAAASALAVDSDPVVTVVRLDLDSFVVAAADVGADAALAVRRLANEVAAAIDDAHRLDPDGFCRLLLMEGRGELNSTQARDVLRRMLDTGGDPAAIAAELGFEAMGADFDGAAVDDLIADHPAEWARFVGGEDKLQGFFIGKIKAATEGKAALKAVSAMLRERRATAETAPGFCKGGCGAGEPSADQQVSSFHSHGSKTWSVLRRGRASDDFSTYSCGTAVTGHPATSCARFDRDPHDRRSRGDRPRPRRGGLDDQLVPAGDGLHGGRRRGFHRVDQRERVRPGRDRHRRYLVRGHRSSELVGPSDRDREHRWTGRQHDGRTQLLPQRERSRRVVPVQLHPRVGRVRRGDRG